ncbi:MAG: nucleotidyltransferase domain-containing protein [bacterium]|nr:nucleotidyltransferase domain-containing protein [bacterium]
MRSITDVLFDMQAVSDDQPFWAKIKANTALQREINRRNDLFNTLKKIFDSVPVTMEIKKALELKIITAEVLTGLYRRLTDFLESDRNHASLILYLPFELLPDADSDSNSELSLAEAKTSFVSACRRRWEELLEVHEPRANFVDGDIFEPEIRREQPCVVKAAHLIPKLVEKNIISIQDITSLLKKTDNTVLRKSILETLPVLEDLGFITAYESEKMFLTAGVTQTQVTAKPSATYSYSYPSTLTILRDELLQRIKHINEQYAVSQLSEKRIRWEKETAGNSALEDFAQQLKYTVTSGFITYDELNVLLTGNDVLCRGGIMGLGYIIENLAKRNFSAAQGMAGCFKETLLQLWRASSNTIKDEIISLLSRWHALAIVTEDYLCKFKIKLPKLDETNLLTESEFSEITEIIHQISNNAELGKMIYPVCLAFGSRLKGYARLNADLDIAIFIRPETNWSDRQTLLDKLAHILNDKEVVEFWLEANGDKLNIREVPLVSSTIGEPDWIHILFQGIWYGRELNTLLTKLLPYYLTANEAFRKKWLGQMELDVLRYRLMHKGYRRFYPECGGLETEHSYLLNSQSAFWDSGYRRIATKLFIKKIFLPSLSSL